MPFKFLLLSLFGVGNAVMTGLLIMVDLVSFCFIIDMGWVLECKIIRPRQ